MWFRKIVLFASRIWSFLSYAFYVGKREVVQHQTVKYPVTSISQIYRLSTVKRKYLVLDLDETLIHSHHEGVRPLLQMKVANYPPDLVLKVVIERHPVMFFVHKRPHVDFFLSVVSQWYELIVFTASMEIYGSAISDALDRNTKILKRRYYRQHCSLEYGSYTKDLSLISADLSNVFIIDNSPGAYRGYPDNAVPIDSWYCDPQDQALLNLLPMLDALRFVNDVRSVLSRNLHIDKHCSNATSDTNS